MIRPDYRLLIASAVTFERGKDDAEARLLTTEHTSTTTSRSSSPNKCRELLKDPAHSRNRQQFSQLLRTIRPSDRSSCQYCTPFFKVSFWEVSALNRFTKIKYVAKMVNDGGPMRVQPRFPPKFEHKPPQPTPICNRLHILG